MRTRYRSLFILLALVLSLTACDQLQGGRALTEADFALADIPAYAGEPYAEVNDNLPYFSADELSTEAFELYSPMDDLGRCGTAYANICPELMPTEERGEIGMVKPSGWHTVRYDDLVDGKYLYNRCHLIGYQLAGENANEANLITGTRAMNVDGMLPFENDVADYVDETGNHVLYRVTPVFLEQNLVASGVLMEAYSVEDEGAGVCYCVYVYNVQPGITIDYATGESWVTGDEEPVEDPADASQQEGSRRVYITPTGSKYHYDGSCNGGTYIESTLDEALSLGLTPCKRCAGG